MHQLTVYKSPAPKIRLGRANDGGYVIADLPGGYDHLITGGVGAHIDFELALLAAHPTLRGDLYDGTVPGLPVAHERLTFHRQNLGKERSAELTDLHEEMMAYCDLFVKIDIEGHEFRLLPRLIAQGDMRRIKQLVLEVHTPADMARDPHWYAGLHDVSPALMQDTLAALTQTHVLVHLHANNNCPVHYSQLVPCPNVFECTYVRRDCFSRFELSDEAIPSPLDMPCDAQAPEIYLRGYPYNTLDAQDYTAAFRDSVVREVLQARKSLMQVAVEHRVHPGQIMRWAEAHFLAEARAVAIAHG